ncbi:hypothetical protein Acsp03_69230 [Actinomadura sp. NBRC 104412]|uniref:nuclear transport factor 2 family protein n=1 Tax=Actinomadura sp. NBRC 104412 TaxID=3032203 RepID=UPI00249F9E9F|nr:nuclear transport factor 2 family protein [Actinomadura sp. NBRC 104412]GLZ09457.1 hypothetical protein Acsp03_69230 [Actinomadura sp. NBRC 104412]
MTKSELLGAFGEAWRGRDIDLLMSFMTDDCEFRASVGNGPGTVFQGRDDVRRGFQIVLGYDREVTQVDLGLVFVSGNHGAVQWTYAKADGTKVYGCDLYEFSGERIRVKDAYRKVHAELPGVN